MRVAEFVGSARHDWAWGSCFGVVGSGNFEVTNALRANGVPFVAARHEAGAATMADAYARMSGIPAIVTTHQGCGFTNALTGITEAAKSRTPLLVLAADTAGAAVRSNFRIDQDAIARAVGAVPERVHSPASAADDVVRAYRTAVNDRRTVVLNLPLDVQAAPAPDVELPRVHPVSPVRPGDDALTALAQALDGAQRPVFVAGRGARHAGPALRKLAVQSGALLATSAVANGLFVGDELRSASPAVRVAARRRPHRRRRPDHRLGMCAEHVDDAARQPDRAGRDGRAGRPRRDRSRRPPPDRPRRRRRRCRDRAGVARRTTPGTATAHRRCARRSPPNPVVPGAVRRPVHRHRDRPAAAQPGSTTLLPAQRISRSTPATSWAIPAPTWVPDEFGFCFTQAFQSIGLGLFTAIGTALARPDRLPVAAVGDGGFLMGISELETLVRLRIRWSSWCTTTAATVPRCTTSTGADHSTVTFPDTDIAAIARATARTG